MAKEKRTAELLKQLAPEIEKATGVKLCVTEYAQQPAEKGADRSKFAVSIFQGTGDPRAATEARIKVKNALEEQLFKRNIFTSISFIGFESLESTIRALKNPVLVKNMMSQNFGSREFFFGKPLYGSGIHKEVLARVRKEFGKTYLQNAKRGEDKRISELHQKWNRETKEAEEIMDYAKKMLKPAKGRLTQESIKPIKGLAIQQLVHLLGHAPQTAHIRQFRGQLKGAIAGYKGLPCFFLKEHYESPSSIFIDRSVRLPFNNNNSFTSALQNLTKGERAEIMRQFGSVVGFLHKNGLRHGDLFVGNNVFIVKVREKSGKLKPQLIIKDFETAGLLHEPKARFKIIGAYCLTKQRMQELSLKPRDLLELHHPPDYGNIPPAIIHKDKHKVATEEIKEDLRLPLDTLSLHLKTRETNRLKHLFDKAYEKELTSKPLFFRGRSLDYWAKNNPFAKRTKFITSAAKTGKKLK